MRSLFLLVSTLVVLIMLMNCSVWFEGVSALSGADQDEVVKDLFHKLSTGSVVVFAAGHVSGQMTLFISGLGGRTDFNGGYQVTVKDDPADGRFSVDSALMLTSKYTSITGAEVMFVCQDSDGSSSLVTMSKDIVGALNLGQNKFTKLNVNDDDFQSCFAHGKLHFSTNEAKTYYVVDQSSGSVKKYALSGESISSSINCYDLLNKVIGKLCKIGEDKITLSPSCSGSPPENIISGYVGSSTAYLFDGDNTVYYFDASVFTSSSEKTVDLKKVDKKDAWQSSRQAGSSQKPPKPITEGTGSNPALIAIIVILGLLLLLIAIGVTLYCCLLSPEKDAKKKKTTTTTNSKGKAGKGKNESKTKSKAPFSPSSAKGSKRKSSRSPDSKKKSSSKQK